MSQFDSSDLRLGQGGHHVRGDAQHCLSLRVRGDGGRGQAQHVLPLDPKIGRCEWDATSSLGLHAKLSCNSHLGEIREMVLSNQDKVQGILKAELPNRMIFAPTRMLVE